MGSDISSMTATNLPFRTSRLEKVRYGFPVLICARSLEISTLKPSMARASQEVTVFLGGRGGEILVQKKAVKKCLGKFWLRNIWLGNFDVHIFVEVIFHLSSSNIFHLR